MTEQPTKERSVDSSAGTTCYTVPIIPVDATIDAEIEGYFDNRDKRVIVRENARLKRRQKAKSDLVKVSAQLLMSRMSDFREDYPKTMPVSVLRQIERHNEKIRLLAIEVRRIYDVV